MNIPAIGCFMLQPEVSNLLCVVSSLSDRGHGGAFARPSAIHFSPQENDATTLDRNRFWKHFSFSKVPLGKFPSRSGLLLFKKVGAIVGFFLGGGGFRREGTPRAGAWNLCQSNMAFFPIGMTCTLVSLPPAWASWKWSLDEYLFITTADCQIRTSSNFNASLLFTLLKVLSTQCGFITFYLLSCPRLCITPRIDCLTHPTWGLEGGGPGVGRKYVRRRTSRNDSRSWQGAIEEPERGVSLMGFGLAWCFDVCLGCILEVGQGCELRGYIMIYYRFQSFFIMD